MAESSTNPNISNFAANVQLKVVYAPTLVYHDYILVEAFVSPAYFTRVRPG